MPCYWLMALLAISEVKQRFCLGCAFFAPKHPPSFPVQIFTMVVPVGWPAPLGYSAAAGTALQYLEWPLHWLSLSAETTCFPMRTLIA